jgi:hypothetical protein
MTPANSIDLHAEARPHMLPDRHSLGFRICIDTQNMQDTNQHLSRRLPDLNERIEANVLALMAKHGLNYAEFYIYSARATAATAAAAR